MRKLLFVLVCGTFSLFAQRVDPLIFSEKIHDFGEIKETDGKVEFEFRFVNNTARPILILNVETSCGCTTTGYSKEVIKQGASGFVKASFEPKGRPGYFNKSINVTTDYASEPIVLQIKGQVNTDAEMDPLKELTAKNGNLRLKHNSFSFSKVYINKEPMEKEFAVLNIGDKPIHFTSKPITPGYISITLPEVIAPQQQAIIKIRYDARKRGQYGFYSDAIDWQSDDELQPLKSFSIYATIEEYFAPLAEAEKLKAPVLQLQQLTLALGRITSEAEIQKEILVKNGGKKDLIIRALQPNCSCIQVTAGKTIIKAGGEQKIFIAFNPKGRTGQQNKSITIYSTDPINPVQRVLITGYIPN